MNKLKLLMGRPIMVNEEHNILVHQPLMSDVVDMTEDQFNEYLMPYSITTEAVFGGVDNEEELIEQFHIFDLFFIKVKEDQSILDGVFGKNALDVLKESLSFFLRTDDIQILEMRQKIIVNQSYIMDKNEFMNVRRAIQFVCNREDVKVEKPPPNMTARQKDIWTKLQKGRKRKAEKEAVYLQDMINFTSHGGKSFIPLREIDSMTYYQLHNAYKSIMGIDSFNIGMGYKLSQKYDVKDDIKHWTNALKIGK